MDFLVRYGSYFLTPMHICVCLVLVAVVLLQTGKGADWAGVFGGAGTQTAFGPRGVENTLTRLTKIAAVVFMVTSFSLSLLQSRARRGTFEGLHLPAAAPKKHSSTTPTQPVAGASSTPAAAASAVPAPQVSPEAAPGVPPAATGSPEHK